MQVRTLGVILALLIAFVVIMLSTTISKTRVRGAKCEAKGGVELRTYHGLICAKVERIIIP